MRAELIAPLHLAIRLLWPRPAGGWVRVHPRLRRAVPEARDWSAADFLALSGEIVSGHPRRHVVALRLGERQLRAFAKREHAVTSGVRWRNLLAGYGLVSDSEREGRTLDTLRRAGVPVPQWLAYGEDGSGRAFLLLAARRDSRPLPRILDAELPAGHSRRRKLAQRIGTALAAVHAAGYDHPDLLAKHILVRRGTSDIALIDWPRSQRCDRVPMHRRARDLALLAASLHGRASERELRAGLTAYWRASLLPAEVRNTFARAVIARMAVAAKRRCVRRSLPPAPGPAVRLRWLRGESLCVTRELWQSLGWRLPLWIKHLAEEEAGSFQAGTRRLNGWGRVEWYHRPAPRRPLWSFGGPPRSPEIQQASWLTRLRRHGVIGPRVLAFGQQPSGASFLLVRPSRPAAALSPLLQTGEARHWRFLGDALRRMHASGCRWAGPNELLQVRGGREQRLQITDAQFLRRFRSGRDGWAELAEWLPWLPANRRRACCVALVQGYTASKRLDATGRSWASRLIRRGEG